MYQIHGLLVEPNDDTSLWRYMDFPKFFSILESHSLFFPKIILFDDPFEGHPPRPTIEVFRKIPDGLSKEEYIKRLKVTTHNIGVLKESRNLICVSCWHANPVESAAMWELYLKSGEGIAIRTTFGRFKEAFNETEIVVNGGLVEYVDFETHKPDRVNVVLWAMLKRISFEHEKEFRTVVMDPSINELGVSIPVRPDILIDEIYVSPTAPNWTIHLLQRMLKRYNFDRDVKRSELLSHPMYYQDGQT